MISWAFYLDDGLVSKIPNNEDDKRLVLTLLSLCTQAWKKKIEVGFNNDGGNIRKIDIQQRLAKARLNLSILFYCRHLVSLCFFTSACHKWVTLIIKNHWLHKHIVWAMIVFPHLIVKVYLHYAKSLSLIMGFWQRVITTVTPNHFSYLPVGTKNT